MELAGRPVTVDELAALGLCNYGHFTSMLVEASRVRGLTLHLDRLVDDCRVVFDAELVRDRIRDLVRRVERPPTAILRVTVFAPDLQLGNPGQRVSPEVLVSMRPAAGHPLPPLRLRSVAYQRELAAVKHVGLFGTMLHRRAAQLAGFDDAVFVDAKSRVSEGATWNIGFVGDDDRIIWPTGDCLSGVTMRLLDAACASIGIETVTREVDLAAAQGMRAAFVTNAAVGVRPVAALNGAAYATDLPLLQRLHDLYRAIPGDML